MRLGSVLRKILSDLPHAKGVPDRSVRVRPHSRQRKRWPPTSVLPSYFRAGALQMRQPGIMPLATNLPARLHLSPAQLHGLLYRLVAVA